MERGEQIWQVANHHIEELGPPEKGFGRWSVSKKEHLSGGDINEIQR
jgi:hypothetical protein